MSRPDSFYSCWLSHPWWQPSMSLCYCGVTLSLSQPSRHSRPREFGRPHFIVKFLGHVMLECTWPVLDCFLEPGLDHGVLDTDRHIAPCITKSTSVRLAQSNFLFPPVHLILKEQIYIRFSRVLNLISKCLNWITWTAAWRWTLSTCCPHPANNLWLLMTFLSLATYDLTLPEDYTKDLAIFKKPSISELVQLSQP